MKPIKLFVTITALSGLIATGFDEAQKRRGEVGTDNLDTQHDIQVFGRTKGQSHVGEYQFTRRAANQRILI